MKFPLLRNFCLTIPLCINASLAFAAASTGTIQLADADGKSCQLTASGDGTTHLIRSCDLSASFLRVMDVPSTTTITLSAKDCSDSTESQNWWVRLQATARSTSTVPEGGLNVTNIVNEAVKYLANPTADVYVGPNLKITGAGVKRAAGPNEVSKCAVMRLPVSESGRAQQVKVQFLPEHSGQSNLQGCSDSALFMNYFPANNDSGDPYKYGWIQQCMRLTDANDNPFYTHYRANYDFRESAKNPTYCPAGQLATGIAYWSPSSKFFLQCAAFHNSKTDKRLDTSSRPQAGRWVESKDNIMICEKPNTGAPEQLIWNSNSAITGWHVNSKSKSHQAWCSSYIQE
ncbi:hypothetical protein [Pseudomonas sp. RIT-PI-S]|uniref:hypothetical protein n=1 Tax=Pseudomonas sp. RIT-PI-S TaxID=3035295 RepID=UPI0021D80DE4|nr:hypothetical protein [Pseudomonas sp. RIT-PI-S]